MPTLRKLSCCVALASAFAAPAIAADVTPEQAAQIQTQLQAWSGLFGSLPNGSAGAPVLKVTADGDHYRIELLAPDTLVKQGVVAAGPLETLQAKPIDGGRYTLGGLSIPQPLKFTFSPSMMDGLNGAAAAAQPGAAPGKPAKPTEPLVVEATTKGQTLTGVIDPTFATPSNADTNISGLHATAAGVIADVAEFVSHTAWTPTGNGLVNIANQTNVKTISVSGEMKSDIPFAVFVDSGKLDSAISGAKPGYSASMSQKITELTESLKRTGDAPLSAEQRQTAHEAVKAFDAALVNQKSTASIDGLKFASGGESTEIAHSEFFGSFATDAGKLTFAFGTTIEGLKSSLIPPGPMQDLLPKRIVLNPRIYGISRVDAIALADHAIDADMKDPAKSAAIQGEAMALLAKGPVGVAIDQLVIDIPGSSLKGSATVDIPNPANITAHALLTMDGLDALIQKANSTPMLAQAAPGLIFLKGIGKADGNVTTWNISYVANKIMVNDTDLSAMIPGNQPAAQPRPQGQPRPRPPAPKSP